MNLLKWPKLAVLAMKIPRDLYYILSRQNFRNTPWRWEHPVEKGLNCLVEKSPSFELRKRDPVPGFASEQPPVRPYRLRESEICFFPPARAQANPHHHKESICFEPFAFHTGDEQPLRVEEARELAEDEKDLELMHVPVRYLAIRYGDNFHTLLTDSNFESVVGQMRKPVGLAWRFQKSPIVKGPNGYHITWEPEKKVEFLQECMAAFRIVDPGSKSIREAAQVFTRLLSDRYFNADDTDEDFYWVNWDPLAPVGHASMPGPNQSTTLTSIEIPPEISNTAEDEYPTYKKAQIRVMANHEGYRNPIPVAMNKALDKNTELMQVPMGYIGWIPSEERQEVFEQPVDWTWTAGWEEPLNWEWAKGWEEPSEQTWPRFRGSYCDTQKIVFLRHYAKMIYIVDTDEGIEEHEVVRAIEQLAGIKLRHSTNSLGQDYWWKVQYGGSSMKSTSRSSGFSKPPSRPGKDRSDPRVPSQTVADLYGGSEDQAHTHWCNTH